MTLNLTANTSNRVVTTFNEKRTINDPFYIVKLINQQSLSEVIFYAEDTSVNQDRYNQFQWIITGSTYVNLTGGTINLEAGEYKYYAYQSVTLSLTPADWTGLVEQGRARINASETIVTYSGANITNTIVYRP